MKKNGKRGKRTKIFTIKKRLNLIKNIYINHDYLY